MKEPRTSPGCAWAVGVAFGAITVFALFATGIGGIGFGLVAVGLIAWKGPRLAGLGGYLLGLGTILTLLFGRVLLTCVTEGRPPGSGCDGGDIELWTGIAAAMLIAGLLATGGLLRSSWRGRDRES